jgi:Tfp pilus assembly protein PilP
MCTKRDNAGKCFIIWVLSLFLCLCASCGEEVREKGDESLLPQVEEEEDVVLLEVIERPRFVTTIFNYRSYGRRDPFRNLAEIREKRMKEEEGEVLERGLGVKIEELKLVGVIMSGEEGIALLDRGDVSYILERGRLLGENYRVIEDVVGKVRDDHVVLFQGGRRVVLKLEEGSDLF